MSTYDALRAASTAARLRMEAAEQEYVQRRNEWMNASAAASAAFEQEHQDWMQHPVFQTQDPQPRYQVTAVVIPAGEYANIGRL